LGGYIRQLPARARTRLALGQGDGVWGLGEHLQALALDELRTANWQRANEGVPQSQQSKRPKPILRPGGQNTAADTPRRAAARQAALTRAAERRRAIAAGEIA
jgi:hypothetical protein